MKLMAAAGAGGILAIYLIDLLELLLPRYQFPFKEDREAIWQAAVRAFALEQQHRNPGAVEPRSG